MDNLAHEKVSTPGDDRVSKARATKGLHRRISFLLKSYIDGVIRCDFKAYNEHDKDIAV